jgi:hypothetical protein
MITAILISSEERTVRHVELPDDRELYDLKIREYLGTNDIEIHNTFVNGDTLVVEGNPLRICGGYAFRLFAQKPIFGKAMIVGNIPVFGPPSSVLTPLAYLTESIAFMNEIELEGYQQRYLECASCTNSHSLINEQLPVHSN